jgi:hypothetical protein
MNGSRQGDCILRVGIVAGGLAAILLALASPAGATFAKHPYLQNLTDSSIVIRWQSAASQGGMVQYGLTDSYGIEADQGSPSIQHEVLLAPLMPDTLYHYRVISAADTSADAVFHTPVGIDRSFRFTVYGDDRTNHADHQRVVDQMGLVDPAPGFLLNVGDLTASGSVSDYATFFNIEGGLLSRETLFPALGNHDLSGLTNWTTFFALPNNERWYSFRYGNSVFHMLDNYSTYTPGSPQYEWFVNELEADSADVSIRHIFVDLHQPPYTTNLGHPSDTTVRQYLCPLFERFHVRAVFNGHVHCYEHSLVNDVHYVISGGGGAPLYDTWGPEQPWTVYREATLEFTLVEVRGDTVDVETVKPGGEVIDPFRIIRPQGPSAVPPAALAAKPGLRVLPNPSDGAIRFSFDLPAAGWTRLEVYDVEGRWIATVVDGELPAGERTVEWPGKGISAGAYFAVLRVPDRTETLRFVRRR